jgi:hypothetical protein
MPVHKGKDKKGEFFQWGSAKKYYFNPRSPISIRRAYRQAKKQGIAIILNR